MTKIEELWRDALQQARNKPIEANGFRLTRMAPESRFDIYARRPNSSSFVLLAIGIHARPPPTLPPTHLHSTISGSSERMAPG